MERSLFDSGRYMEQFAPATPEPERPQEKAAEPPPAEEMLGMPAFTLRMFE
jgi:hypothetical protein